jgi:hypothetical protein
MSGAKTPFTPNNQSPTLRQISERANVTGVYLRDQVQTTKASALITIPLAQGETNNELANFIPANSLVTSLGIFFTENANIDTSGTLAVAFGNASEDESIVASTQLNAAGTDIVINSFTSTSSKHALTSGGTAIAFAADSALWFGNESSLFFQTIVGAADLTALCQVKVVMEFLTVSNS